jgi:hypothetical protein
MDQDKAATNWKELAWLGATRSECGARPARRAALVAVIWRDPLSADGHPRQPAVLIVECADATAELVVDAQE